MGELAGLGSGLQGDVRPRRGGMGLACLGRALGFIFRAVGPVERL